MSDKLQTAIDAIKIGAEIARTYQEKEILFELKEDKSVVTKADKEVENNIKDYILSKFPGAKFVGEETGGSINENEFWIIDPIDGTRSFIRGVPTWAVMIAHCQNRDIDLGVCYFPMLNTFIWAEKGQGTYRDGVRVNVSKVDKLNKAYVSIGNPKDFKNKAIFHNLVEESWNLKILSSYGEYLVACGSMDVFVGQPHKLWDIAPFKVIIEEAGGKVTRLDGSPWKVEGEGAIISNGLLHDEVIQLINK